MSLTGLAALGFLAPWSRGQWSKLAYFPHSPLLRLPAVHDSLSSREALLLGGFYEDPFSFSEREAQGATVPAFRQAGTVLSPLSPGLRLERVQLTLPHPAIHLLVSGFIQTLSFILVLNQGQHLWRIWTKRPSDPPPTFPRREMGNDLLVLLSPYVLIASLLFLRGYPW